MNSMDGRRNAFITAFGGSGVGHFLIPDFFVRLIPEAVPGRRFWVYISGVAELLVALGLLLPRTRRPAARGVLGLLLLFTPLHVIDLMRDRPVAVNKAGALVRLLLQAWLIHQANEMANES